MILEHFAPAALEMDFTRQYEQREHNKPRGFWVSVQGEDDWPKWVEAEQFGLDVWAVRHEVQLTKDANILHLKTPLEIMDFHAEYNIDLLPGSPMRTKYINWQAVSETYDGIIIAPYQWSLRLDIDVSWYYGWDVASGCIWNLNSIESVSLASVDA